jgi:hypothetical protein
VNHIIEEESGTTTLRRYHPHNGYYAGDFSGTRQTRIPTGTFNSGRSCRPAPGATASSQMGGAGDVPPTDQAPSARCVFRPQARQRGHTVNEVRLRRPGRLGHLVDIPSDVGSGQLWSRAGEVRGDGITPNPPSSQALRVGARQGMARVSSAERSEPDRQVTEREAV